MPLSTMVRYLISGANASVLLLLLFIANNAYAVPQVKTHNNFVGSERCAQCHEAETKQWKQSHHAKSMMLPSAESVLGDFNNKEVTFNDVTTRFTQNEQGYYINTQNEEKKQQTYKVEFTFGYTPLQQYLIDSGDGKLQAFDIAWDSRSAEDGGQRWFKLLPNEDTNTESPFHWTKQLQNWNSRCAECHSTNLNKGYNPVYRRYETTFSEVNVACESCHGGGNKHVNMVASGEYKKGTGIGFDTHLKQTRNFVFEDKKSIAVPKGEHTAAQINACGGCHSRRQVIGEINPANNYHDQYSLRLLDDPLYYADGQIQDEVFVLGSFMQSKMYKAGVTCTNCHNAHTGEVKAQDNSLCTQCHLPAKYDVEQHAHHKKDSLGALCVNCHMPATTYMEVDDRRDHSFSIPTPQHSDKLETPNACNRCHKAQSSEWSAKTIESWGKETTDYFGLINAKARKADVLALRPMTAYIDDERHSDIRRAALLSLTSGVPSRLTAETIVKQLSSDSELVRRAAVEASGFIPLQQRWTLLKPLVKDPSASVRYAVANQLAGYAQHVEGEDYIALSALFREYEQQLLISQDMPGGQASMAVYALAQGDIDGALSAINKALEIEPDFAPALLNLADIHRSMGDEVKAKEALERGINVAPDSGALQHSYGLYWVRQKNMAESLTYLKAATEQEDRTARYFYVYAVALENTGNLKEAILTLQQANDEWPNQYELLITLVMYLEQDGRENESLLYLSKLSAIAPNDPEVKRRIAEMRREK